MNTIQSKERENTLTILDIDRYQGYWWEIASYPLIYSQGCSRATAMYEYDSGNKILKVTNNCLDPKNNIIFSRSGEAYIPKFYDQGKLRLNFMDGLPSDGESDYWVHWTDYDHYAIVGSRSGKFLWILSRHEAISKSDARILLEYVKCFGYDPDQLMASPSAIA